MNVRRMLMGLVSLSLMAPLLALMPAASAQGASSCAVTDADRGVNLTWTLDPAAETYVYRIDIEGANPRFRQVDGGSAFLELAEGIEATVSLSSKYPDGSYEPRRQCGTAQANPGTGGQDTECTVVSAAGGVDVSWTAVRDAVQYVYRLETPDNANRYGRVDGTSTFLSLGEGVVGTVAVSAVFADRRYQPAVSCGSAAPTSGTGDQPFTCSASSTPGGVALTWSTQSTAVRYVYRLEVDGRSNRYGSATGNQTVAPVGPAGTVVTVFLSGQDANGRYSPSISCGTATVGGELPQPVITECRVVDTPEGILFEWDADNTANADQIGWVYRFSWEEPGVFEQGDVGRVSGTETRQSLGPIDWPPGTRVTRANVSIEFLNNERVVNRVIVDCGTGVRGGEIEPPGISSCNVVDTDRGIVFVWNAFATETVDQITWVYRYSWTLPDGTTQSEVGRAFGVNARSIDNPIDWPAGTQVSATLSIETIDNERVVDGPVVDCGTGVRGGPAA